MRVRWLASVAAVLMCAGCASSPATAVVSVGDDVVATVEVARSAEEQRVGLAGRADVAGGMLFSFGTRQEREVWMADVMVPLDVAWISDGVVVEVRTLQPCLAASTELCERWKSPGPVDALLELPAGALDNIVAGAVVSVDETDGNESAMAVGGVRSE